MNGAKKILAMMVMITMVSAGLIIVSPQATVSAENSSSQFALLMDGYPQVAGANDAMQLMFSAPITVSNANWRSQSFRPTVNGDLTTISLNIWQNGGNGMVLVDIYNTDQAEKPIPGNVIASESIPSASLSATADNWFDITFSTPATLTAGTEYAIVVHPDPSCGIYWYYYSSNVYIPGGVSFCVDGSGFTWNTNPSVEMAFLTYMEQPAITPTKVAWHENGEYALAVNGVDETIYKFDRQSSAWSTLGYTFPSIVFNDVTYDPAFGEFYLVGVDTSVSRPHAYYYDGSNIWNIGTPSAQTGEFHAVTAIGGDSSYKFLAVGERTGGWGYAAWYRDGFGWIEVLSDWSGGVTETLYDVTWNQQTGAPNRCYGVGEDGNSHGFVFTLQLGTTNALREYTYDSDSQFMEPQHSIAWNPGWDLGAEFDYALIGASTFMGYGNVLKFDGSSPPDVITDISDTIYDIAWKPDGEMAILVGENSGNEGVVYYHPVGSEELLPQDMEAPAIFGVAYKGYTSPSSAIMVSSGGSIAAYPSATDIGTTITVNSAFPHSFDIDMWKTSDAGRASKLNTQVNVETTYTFMTEVNYSVNGIDQFYADGEQDVWILLTAWYDDGLTPSPDPDDTDYNRTKNFQAIWQEGAVIGADTAGMVYPGVSPGTDEVQFDSAGIEAGPDDHYYVYINLTLGPQLWAGDGQGFTNGAAPDINDGATAFNDPDSWDFVMTIVDINYMDAVNSSFEEFGLFRFTNITVSGNPSGNALPGSVNNGLGASQIAVSSNIPYYVNVSIPRLNMTTDDSKFIPASSVNVSLTSAFANNTNTQMNGSWGVFGRALPGANQQLGVWGNASLAQSFWTVPAPLNSTTAHGPQGEDFQGLGDTFVQWYVNVPGATAEGTYQATITFRIGYY